MGIVLKVKENRGGFGYSYMEHTNTHTHTHKDYYIPHMCFTFVTKYKQPDLPTVFIPQNFL